MGRGGERRAHTNKLPLPPDSQTQVAEAHSALLAWLVQPAVALGQ